MTEKILVAVDGKAAGDRAVTWAAAHAARTGAEIVVFQATDQPETIVTGDRARRVAEVAEEIATRAIERIHATAPGVQATSRIEHGDVVELLQNASQDVDLVVVGTNGPGGLFAPSTRAVRITAVSSRPVVITPDTPAQDRAGVVVGLDGSEPSTRALAFAAHEAHTTGQKLVALTAWQLPSYYGYEGAWPTDIDSGYADYARERGAEQLAELQEHHPDLEIEHRVAQGSSAELLIEESAEACLVVMGSRGLGRVRSLLLGSVSHTVILHAKGPVAVVH